MTDTELRDELMTLLVAGHETTATALAWTLERIVRTPHVLERLYEQGGADDDDYIDAVCKESLRLRPVVPAAARELQEPMTLGGMRLPGRRHRRPLDRPHAPARGHSIPSRTPSGPSASSSAPPGRTSGSRSEAACGAASARPSPCSRCARC